MEVVRIDVTRRSIEETAATILGYYSEYKSGAPQGLPVA